MLVREGFKRGAYPLMMIGGDLAAFYSSLWVAYQIRLHVISRMTDFPFTQTFGDLAHKIWIPLVVIGIFFYEGLYSRRVPFWEETQKTIKALFLGYLMILSIVSLGKLSPFVSRTVLVGTGLISCVIVPLFRVWWKPSLHRMGIGIKKAVLIGENRWAKLARLGIFRDHYMGFRIIGRLSSSPYPEQSDGRVAGEEEHSTPDETLSGHNPPALPFLGEIKDLEDLVKQQAVRCAIVAEPMMRVREVSKLLSVLQKQVLSVYVVPNISQVNLMNSELLYLFYEEIFLLGIHNKLKSRANRMLKNVFDTSLAVLLLILMLPVMGIIALAIRLGSPGPVLFTQWRVGQDKKAFRIYKFRTMVQNAEEKLNEIIKSHAEWEEEFLKKQKIENDPRITRFGRFLRATSLDELPQLLNVIRGEMSLVGPRPVTEEELVERYKEVVDDYALVRPGITGLWQVSGRSDRGYGVRIRLDSWYVQNWSLWLDLVILVRTIGVVVSRKGSY